MPRVGATADARRLEQPVVGLAHRPRAGQRGEVGGALCGVARAEGARDGAEHQRAEPDGEQPADEQHGDLAACLSHHPHGAARGSERSRASPAIAAQRGGPGGSGGTTRR